MLENVSRLELKHGRLKAQFLGSNKLQSLKYHIKLGAEFKPVAKEAIRIAETLKSDGMSNKFSYAFNDITITVSPKTDIDKLFKSYEKKYRKKKGLKIR